MEAVTRIWEEFQHCLDYVPVTAIDSSVYVTSSCRHSTQRYRRINHRVLAEKTARECI